MGGVNSPLLAQSFCGSIVRDTSWLVQQAQRYGAPLFYDRFGNAYTEEELLGQHSQMPPPPCGDTGFFTLEFLEDVNAAWTDEEMQTICQVYADLAAAMAPTTETVLIRIVKTDGLNPGVLGTGSPIWDDSACGIVNTTIHDALQGGDFPPNFAHGIMNILHSGVDWQTLAEDSTTPPFSPGEYDLYTVALHEALHIMGFASKITPSGAPSNAAYSQWDDYLYKMDNAGTLIPLLIAGTGTTCCEPYDFNSAQLSPMPDVLTGTCATKVVFSTNGSTVLAPVNRTASEPGEMRNRLSHLQIDCKSSVGVNNTEQYVMHPSIDPLETRRLLTNTEKEILCQLGYPMLSASNCFNVECISSVDNESYSIVLSQGNTLSISTADLLANDNYTGTVTVDYMPGCGSLVNFAGQTGLSVSFNGSDFTITATYPGAYSFCYAVFCGNYCEMGTVHVDVMTVPFPIDCDGTCNLTPYGDIEAFPLGNNKYTSTINPYSPQFDGQFWSASSDVYTEDGINQYAHFFTYNDAPEPYVEYIFLPLCKAVPAGCTLNIQFDACATRWFCCTQPSANSGYLSFFAIDGMVNGCPIGATGIYAPTFPTSFLQCPAAASFPLCNATAYPMTNDPAAGCGVFMTTTPMNGSGTPLPLPPMSTYTVQWTNTTGLDIEHLMIVPTGILTGGQADGERNFYIDNIIVESSCRPIVDISAEPHYDCTNNESTINYTICLNAESPATSVVIDLTPQITSPLIGIPLIPEGDFAPNGTAQVTLVPGQCTDLMLNFHVPCGVTPNTIIPVQLNASAIPQGSTFVECVDVNSEPVDFEFDGCCDEIRECLGYVGFNLRATTPIPNVQLHDGRNAFIVANGVPGTYTWTLTDNEFITLGVAGANQAITTDIDIVVPSGVHLIIKSVDFNFSPKARILVERNAVLQFDNISTNEISDLNGLCQTVWQGIQVAGPGAPNAFGGIFNPRIDLPVRNYGILGMRALNIRDAIIGVAGMKLPFMDINDLNVSILNFPEFSPQNNGLFPTVSSAVLFAYTASNLAVGSAGGRCGIVNAYLEDCLQGINLSWFDNSLVPPLPADPSGSIIQNIRVHSDGLNYPFNTISNLPRTEAGIVLNVYANLDILGSGDVNVTNFSNLKYGIRSVETSNVKVSRNRFRNCTVGTSTLDWGLSPLNFHINLEKNVFNNCTSAMQASGAMLRIKENVINEIPPSQGFSSLGVYLRGCTFDMQYNQINYNILGTVLMGNGSTSNFIRDNIYNTNPIPLWAIGNNGTPGFDGTGTEIKCNVYNNYIAAWSAQDYNPPTGSPFPFQPGSMADQGDCYSGIDGLPADNIFNQMPDLNLDISSTMPTPFIYFYRDDPTQNYMPTSIVPGTVDVVACFGDVFPDEVNCAGGILMADSDIKAINLTRYLNKAALRKLFYYAAEGDKAAARDLMKDIPTKEARRMMLPQYIKEENSTKVTETFNAIPDDNDEDVYFKQLYGIHWGLVNSGRGLPQITPQEEAQIRSIAHSGTRAAYDAHTMLYLLRGEEYDIPLPALPALFNNALLEQFAMQSVHFKTDHASGTNGIAIFPNPATNTLNIAHRLAADETAQISLYDMTGRTLRTWQAIGNGTITTNTETLPAGIYLCRMRINEKIIFDKKVILLK